MPESSELGPDYEELTTQTNPERQVAGLDSSGFSNTGVAGWIAR